MPQEYYKLLSSAENRNQNWASACSHTECTFHQLSPYIGKLKSTIARDLIEQYSRPDEVVIDPFSGSGTIPFEAAMMGRRVIANDASSYAITLTKGKLLAPVNLELALVRAEEMLTIAEKNPLPDLCSVPQWVQEFFHPQTLQESLRLTSVIKQAKDDFMMGCFLGILHHQRPGFLSYPSSHLVPYLRDKLFPRVEFPNLYSHREIRPRLLAKINRIFKRAPKKEVSKKVVFCSNQSVQDLILPEEYDCLITSPPYMNALDYWRDNRLRLWFLGEEKSSNLDGQMNGREAFQGAMISVAKLIEQKLRVGGFAVFVVGEHDARGANHYPSTEVAKIMQDNAPSLTITKIIADQIPDVRRSRRRLSGVKKEHILIYRKGCHA